MPSISTSRTTPEPYLATLAQHAEPVVVLVGPRLRCSVADYQALEYFIDTLAELGRPVTLRVSGMIAGPEEFVERIAPMRGHPVEVYGPDGETAWGRVKRLNKLDDHERDGSALLGAHALWLWLLPSDLSPHAKPLEDPMVILAQEFGIPVFLFLPESSDFEVLELT